MKKLTLLEIESLLRTRDVDKRFQTLKDIPTPNQFKDIIKATNRIIKAIKSNETINLVGDYDADGVTSTAIIVEFFRKALGVEVKYIIPNRFTDGYGISENIVKRIDDGIVITVDNGISSHEAAILCKEKGLDLIITDHHTVGDSIPDAYAIINPKQKIVIFHLKIYAGQMLRGIYVQVSNKL
jgi:single-stranded-DNA-specific exonuclease